MKKRTLDMPFDEKPPYRIPLMPEIAAVPWNGYTAVSTFSGCGGSSLGYKMAGYAMLWANEFIPAAQDTYRANHGGTMLDPRDIRKIKPTDILEATGLDVGEIDVLEGSPPCSAFSMAGKREEGWGKEKPYSDGVKQRVDDLFFEYARLLGGLQPKTFSAENVYGLKLGAAALILGQIVEALVGCGYQVAYRVLDAQWHGVPQGRKRLIFVGVRNDLGILPAFPDQLTYRYSVRDAVPWIAQAKKDVGGFGGSENRLKDLSLDDAAPTILGGGTRYGGRTDQIQVTSRTGPQFHSQDVDLDRPSPTVWASGAGRDQFEIDADAEQLADILGDEAVLLTGRGKMDDLDRPAASIMTHGNLHTRSEAGFAVPTEAEAPSIERFAIGREAEKIGPGESSKKFFNLIKPDPDSQSPTILASHGAACIAGVVHPYEKRKFTMVELRRICGFPDDFILTGTYPQQWERLGRAVPPPLMHAVAAAIRDKILARQS